MADQPETKHVGYMYIKKPFKILKVKTWKWRYFVLRDDGVNAELEYYKDEFMPLSYSRRKFRRHQIFLQDVNYVGVYSKPKTQKNAFVILCSNFWWILACETENDMLHWISILDTYTTARGRPVVSIDTASSLPIDQTYLNQPDMVRSDSLEPSGAGEEHEMESVNTANSNEEGNCEDMNYLVNIETTPSSELLSLRGEYLMNVSGSNLTLKQDCDHRVVLSWSLSSVRGFKSELTLQENERSYMLTIITGRRSQTGEGLFKFSTRYGDVIAKMLRNQSIQSIIWFPNPITADSGIPSPLMTERESSLNQSRRHIRRQTAPGIMNGVVSSGFKDKGSGQQYLTARKNLLHRKSLPFENFSQEDNAPYIMCSRSDCAYVEHIEKYQEQYFLTKAEEDIDVIHSIETEESYAEDIPTYLDFLPDENTSNTVEDESAYLRLLPEGCEYDESLEKHDRVTCSNPETPPQLLCTDSIELDYDVTELCMKVQASLTEPQKHSTVDVFTRQQNNQLAKRSKSIEYSSVAQMKAELNARKSSDPFLSSIGVETNKTSRFHFPSVKRTRTPSYTDETSSKSCGQLRIPETNSRSRAQTLNGNVIPFKPMPSAIFSTPGNTKASHFAKDFNRAKSMVASDDSTIPTKVSCSLQDLTNIGGPPVPPPRRRSDEETVKMKSSIQRNENLLDDYEKTTLEGISSKSKILSAFKSSPSVVEKLFKKRMPMEVHQMSVETEKVKKDALFLNFSLLSEQKIKARDFPSPEICVSQSKDSEIAQKASFPRGFNRSENLIANSNKTDTSLGRACVNEMDLSKLTAVHFSKETLQKSVSNPPPSKQRKKKYPSTLQTGRSIGVPPVPPRRAQSSPLFKNIQSVSLSKDVLTNDDKIKAYGENPPPLPPRKDECSISGNRLLKISSLSNAPPVLPPRSPVLSPTTIFHESRKLWESESTKCTTPSSDRFSSLLSPTSPRSCRFISPSVLDSLPVVTKPASTTCATTILQSSPQQSRRLIDDSSLNGYPKTRVFPSTGGKCCDKTQDEKTVNPLQEKNVLANKTFAGKLHLKEVTRPSLIHQDSFDSEPDSGQQEASSPKQTTNQDREETRDFEGIGNTQGSQLIEQGNLSDDLISNEQNDIGLMSSCDSTSSDSTPKREWSSGESSQSSFDTTESVEYASSI